MGRLDQLQFKQRELEAQQAEILHQLNMLNMDNKGEECRRKELGRLSYGIVRGLKDVRMRIKNLHRTKKKELPVVTRNISEEQTSPVDRQTAENQISYEDDIFNPKSVRLNTTRPAMRLFPKVPLPHSKPVWDRLLRVGRRMDRPVIRRTNWEGQFTGVEEGNLRETGGNECNRQEGFGGWMEIGKNFSGLDKLVTDDLILPVELKSPEKVTGPQILSLCQNSSSPIHCKEAVTKPLNSTHLTTMVKDLCSQPFLTPSQELVTLVSSSKQSHCICNRPLHLVTCSSPSCCHSFYGRVVTPCPHHPTDHYLMDHPTICPICKADPLVEDENLTSIHINSHLFTKIKTNPMLPSIEPRKSAVCEYDESRKASLCSRPGEEQSDLTQEWGKEEARIEDHQVTTVRARLKLRCRDTSCVSKSVGVQEALEGRKGKRLIKESL